jgi:hypothetical protein
MSDHLKGYGNPHGLYDIGTPEWFGQQQRINSDRHQEQLRRNAQQAGPSGTMSPAAAKVLGLVVLYFVAATAAFAIYDKLFLERPDSAASSAVAPVGETTPPPVYPRHYHHHHHFVPSLNSEPSPPAATQE